MKGFESKNVEISSNSNLEGIDLSIDQKDMGFIFDIMFNQMYRDPIGSVIREITSNCFDSHQEAGVNEPVIIEFGDDDGGNYIIFQDFGVGISPDRMKNIYSKPASSTKRNSNDQIGYWGLGSKSPLAYTDSFEVITNHNQIKYHYIVHKGERVPRIEKFDESTTDERNGTQIKIYIKESDRYKFIDKIPQQLRYFDNVYVKGTSLVKNDYRIHIGDTFKFRNDIDTNEFLHICIGKVCYPIDWNKLGIPPINFPAGLKFNIGELPITPERESIRYVAIEKEDGTFVETSQIILEKIEAFKQEIKELASSVETEHNNLVDYYDNKESVSYIGLLDRVINVDQIVERKEHSYTPVASLGIKLPENPYFEYEIHKTLTRDRKIVNIEPYNRKRLTHRILTNNLVVRETTPSGRYKSVKLAYLNKLREDLGKEAVVFVTKKEEPACLRKYLTFPKVKKIDYATMPNKLKIAQRYSEAIKREVILNSYEYESIEVPQDYINWWEEHTKIHKRKVTAKDEEIIVDYVAYEIAKVNRKRAIKISEFQQKPAIIYGFSKDEDLLEKYSILLSIPFKEIFIYRINIRDEKHFITLPNSINVRSLMSNNPIFRKIANSAIVKKSPIWDNYSFTVGGDIRKPSSRMRLEQSVEELKLIFQPLGETVEKLIDLKVNKINFTTKEDETDGLVNEIITIAEENDWIDNNIKTDLKKVENYLKGLDLINYIVPVKEAIPHIAHFFHISGKKVNPEWLKLEDWQKSLMKECQEKFNYYETLTDTNNNSLARIRYATIWYKDLVTSYTPIIKEFNYINTYHDKKAITN